MSKPSFIIAQELPKEEMEALNKMLAPETNKDPEASNIASRLGDYKKLNSSK